MWKGAKSFILKVEFIFKFLDFHCHFFSEGCFVISSVSSFELYCWCFLFKKTCTYYQTWHSSWQPALGGFLDSPVFSLTPWCYMVASNKGFFEISESVSCRVTSHSLWPHRLLPTRLLCAWNSPGKILELVSISFSRGSSWLRDWTHILLHWRW